MGKPMTVTVAALYHFTRFDAPAALRGPLLEICEREGIRGTLLLAEEGINGTVAGPLEGIEAVISHLRALPGCAGLDWKRSEAARMPFRRLKVRLKQEIVTLGRPDADPSERVGTYIDPEDWNALIACDDVAVIDTRNAYETAIGTFEGAIDPQTKGFRDFPGWWQANRDRFEGKRIAMFCTGGIRCEKATSWLLGQGVEDVYHLKGGILKYLEQVPEACSRWRGECYVFDGRVSVGHGLREGDHTACGACGRPVSPDQRRHPDFREGVSCPMCIGEYSEADRARFAERQKQIVLARRKGARHLGEDSK